MGEFEGFALIPEQGVVPEMAQLDADMQARIRALASRIDLRDSADVMGFGARVQKEMSTFSDVALHQMLSKDVQDLGGLMQTLSEQIRTCSFSQEAKGLFRRVFGGVSNLSEVRSAYEKAEPKINACADEMTDRRVMLMRDSALLDRLYERNERLYRELCSLMVIGNEALQQAKARREEPMLIARMERRMEDLRLTQITSTQLAAQIRLIQQNDNMACEKLKMALEVTIPLWKNQMATALGLARATESLTMQRRATQEATRGIRMGTQQVGAQKDAWKREAAEADRMRAQQTADELLKELASIEASLKQQQTIS